MKMNDLGTSPPPPDEETDVPPRKGLPMEAYGLTPSLIATVMAIGTAKGTANAKPKRVSLEARWFRAGLEHEAPPETSKANASYYKRAAVYLAAAMNGSIAALILNENVPAGSNTYSKAMRAYVNGLCEAVAGHAPAAPRDWEVLVEKDQSEWKTCDAASAAAYRYGGRQVRVKGGE